MISNIYVYVGATPTNYAGMESNLAEKIYWWKEMSNKTESLEKCMHMIADNIIAEYCVASGKMR